MTDSGNDLTALIPELRHLARVLTRNRDTADDLAQEALLCVWARIAAGEDIQTLRPYLMTTLRNAHRRTRHRDSDVTLGDDDAALPAQPAEAPGRLALREVMQAIAALPPAQAELLRLLATTGADYADLARQTGLPLGTVTSRLSRARARLRAAVDLPENAPVTTLFDDRAA
ncbi:MAG: RNA polymerase sigma factor [Pseudomonadota bacterium]|jgi:RNA polymerase sigma-70 factor (ECF subfamily)|uniref:RNA polymerase sigma factor n=1 Tax=Actibacterium sp. TaxID=1872125 RepID=UPI00257E5C4C|nr:RNA polymerase sigma factor [Actibacterium sp.]MDY6858016.1 RNA polymerase sigma factor [Pseudomonadota bacterium]|tara:strand:- start:1583 stop:2098 length:516 start_codon:yes stop_codon:yes gene_type:complete